jgi:cell division protease FtsH
MNSINFRSGIVYVLIIVALGAFLYTSIVRRSTTQPETIPIAEVARMVRDGDVERISIKEDRITVITTNNASVQSRKELDTGLVETLRNLGVTTEQLRAVEVTVEAPRFWENWSGILLALLPLILLGAFFFFILRQAQGAGNQAFSFGKSRARMFTGDRPTVTFADVAGNDEAKQELHEVVNF